MPPIHLAVDNRSLHEFLNYQTQPLCMHNSQFTCDFSLPKDFHISTDSGNLIVETVFSLTVLTSQTKQTWEYTPTLTDLDITFSYPDTSLRNRIPLCTNTQQTLWQLNCLSHRREHSTKQCAIILSHSDSV